MTADQRLEAALRELVAALLESVRSHAEPVPDRPVELVSVDTFAKRVGIGRSSAWLLVSSGRVRSVRLGGRRVVPASEIERIAAGEVDL